MPWTIEYLQSAKKGAKKLSPQNRKKVRAFLEERIASMEDPRQLGKPLKGTLSEFWRYRVGDFRILCQLQDQKLVVLVVRIAHRKDVYKRF